MSADGKRARTIQLVHIVLHCAFKQAVKEGLIGQNLMEAVERPRVKTIESLQGIQTYPKEGSLPDIRFHDLRRTSISFLLDMGMLVNTVQTRAGHSKASVTVDVYGHAMACSQEEAAQRIEELVTPIPVELQ